jgi:hypothetical protein
MPGDHDIMTTLRTLDPSDQHPDPRGSRALSDLAHIMTTPTGHGPAPQPRGALRRTPARVGPRGRARPARRAGLAGALVAAVATTVVALPSVTGGDSAYATWTGAPHRVSAEEREAAAGACREQLQAGAGDGDSRLDAAVPVIVESRGAWTTVVLAGTDGFSGLCITDESTRVFDSMIGSLGTRTGDTRPRTREVAATDLGVGSTSAGELSMAVGFAGPDVTAIAYESQERGEVLATVSQGHFALWLPGDELESAPTDGVDVQVTYRDGSTSTRRLRL